MQFVARKTTTQMTDLADISKKRKEKQMARIKCEINEDSTLVKFGAVMDGEVFIFQNEPYMRALGVGERKAMCLKDGDIILFEDTDLVTYVKKAELKLTI